LQNELYAEERAEDQGCLMADNAIPEALEMMPFASIRQVAPMTFILLTTVFRHLTKSGHFVLKRLCSVPDRLWDLQKQTLVIMSNELLKLFESMRHRSWKYIMMLDEVWFYLSTDRQSIWLSPEDEAPQKERKIVSSPK
jgi:hypothetical protein